MAKSVKQLQAESLAYLDSIGASKQGFTESVSIGIQKLLEDSGVNFVLKVQENLAQSGSIDTGALGEELVINPVEISSDTFTLSIGYPTESQAAKYYDFVNKGVKGTRGGPNSQYAFKKETVGGPMQLAIAKWLRRNASAGRLEDAPRKDQNKVQRKRVRLSKMVDQNKRLKSLAYAVSVSIKRKGIKKTGYLDKAIKFSFGKEFNDAVAKVLGREVVINIRNGNNIR